MVFPLQLSLAVSRLPDSRFLKNLSIFEIYGLLFDKTTLA